LKPRRAAAIETAFVAVVAATCVSSLASADVTPDASALAEALFQQGKALMTAHHYDDACPKLAESERLDPAGGTLLTLALCHAAQGKTATAWVEFDSALTAAIRDHEPERELVARREIAALRPKLSRVRVVVPPDVASTPGLVVSRDGLELGAPAWGVAVPADPGEHRVEARAPGKKPFVAAARVVGEGQVAEIRIAPLEDASPASATTTTTTEARPLAPTAAAPAAPPPRSNPPTLARDVTTIGTGLVGVVGLGLGAYWGARAISTERDADDRCPKAACSDPTALAENASAGRLADASTAAFAIAAAGAASCILLLVTRPRSPAPVAIQVGAGAVSARGVW
jgi:serine/threonine-protein kinase